MAPPKHLDSVYWILQDFYVIPLLFFFPLVFCSIVGSHL